MDTLTYIVINYPWSPIVFALCWGVLAAVVKIGIVLATPHGTPEDAEEQGGAEP